MEKRFRIIEEIYYDHEINEKVIYYIQEWKKNWLGNWKWRYWKVWDYDSQVVREFGTKEQAKEMIEKYVKKKPHKIVVEELTY